jgi:hypothetical protein
MNFDLFYDGCKNEILIASTVNCRRSAKLRMETFQDFENLERSNYDLILHYSYKLLILH